MKVFVALIVAVWLRARVFATAIHYHPNLMIVGKAGAYQSEALNGTPLEWQAPSLACKN
jgi:hypothetical protein